MGAADDSDLNHFPDGYASGDHLFVNRDLRELIALRCDGLATPEQVRQLEQCLISDPQAADLYAAHMLLHANLQWAVQHADEISDPLLAVAAVPAPRSRGNPRTIWLVVAASIVAVVCGMLLVPEAAWRGSDVIAWREIAGEQVLLRAGDRVRQGSGLMLVEFANGVRVTLDGQADMELLNPLKVRLHSGQAQVDVGNHGRGFTISTPSTDVVDLGTVFGVAVTPENGSNVVVFSGEVRLSHKGTGASEGTSLLQGEALSVQRDGSVGLLREVWLDSLGNWSTAKRSEVASPIATVSDNRSDEGCSKYYGVVPGGLGEDAAAYVDRQHQWNSLPGVPFPEELLAADYIRTFNDTKFRNSLEINLTLMSPATVYILMDPRHEPPAWLTEQFEPTDLKIGLDLGNADGIDNSPPPPPGITTERHLGSGAGHSVDIPFSIWRRVVQAPQSILLGPNGSPSAELMDAPFGAGSMYGIAVAPLRNGETPASIPLVDRSISVLDSVLRTSF